MATNNRAEKQITELYTNKGKVRDMYDYKKVYITTPKPTSINGTSFYTSNVGKALTLISLGISLGIGIVLLTLTIDGSDSNTNSYRFFLLTELVMLPCSAYLFYKGFIS